MNIHEYQAKDLLKSHGVAVPAGEVASTPDEAVAIAQRLNCEKYVVKAQIHAGGRGKGGGVKLANSPDEVRKHAAAILGMQLVTHQTGPEGKLVRKVIVAEANEIERELYLSMVIDRVTSRVVMMGSEEGGVDIEEVASKRPEKIVRETVDPAIGLTPFQARRMAYGLGVPSDLTQKAAALMHGLYETFIDCDCSLAEINPLAIVKTAQGQNIIALDAKINLDDNALWRHPDLEALRDPHEEDARELEAAGSGLSYISLDGNIGCMVNGAGLAMATMDLIKLHGGEPANFLDVGGGASAEAVAHAFRLILADPKVKAVLVNILGGIMKCDTIASGIVEAVKQVNLHVPLVVRLEGTNVELGKQILANSGLNLIAVDGLSEAAQRAVEAISNLAMSGER